MNIRRIIIFTWQLPKTRVEFVEIFPASSTSFASRVVGPFQSHVLKVSTNLIYIIQTIFHIFFNILLTLCAVVNELNFRWHWGPVKLLEQVAFTSPATLFQNSTRDVPSMSWYSYKYYHNLYWVKWTESKYINKLFSYSSIYRISFLSSVDEGARSIRSPLRTRSRSGGTRERGSGGTRGRGSGGTRGRGSGGTRRRRRHFAFLFLFFFFEKN